MLCEFCNTVSPADRCLNPECVVGPTPEPREPKPGDCTYYCDDGRHAPDCRVFDDE